MRRIDRGSALLGIGSAVGLLVAAGGLLASGHDVARRLPADTVARVNGVAIRGDDYRRALDAVASDRRSEPDAAMRRYVLDRLIDEELLVQRGLELGLTRVDPRVRRELAAAVIAAAVSDTTAHEPSAAELRAFYDAERGFFAGGGRIQVRQVWIAAATPGAPERAATAATRLRAGADLATVRRELGDAEVVPLPDAPLPVAKLADYLGPTPLRAVLTLSPGAVSDPIRSTAGFHVLVVVARDPDDVPAFEDVEGEVRAEWQRRSDERTLRSQLEALRAHAAVEVADIP